MNGAALFHRASDSMCYSPDGKSLTVRLQAAAGDLVSVELWAGDPHDWARGDSVTWSWRCSPNPVRKVGTDGLRDFWEANWTSPYKRARYYWRLTASDGSRWDYGERGLLPSAVHPTSTPAGEFWNAFVFPYINEVDVYRAPEWVAGTVWYQIFPERFRNGDPTNDPAGTKAWKRGPVTNHEFYGGDLRGIIDGLDHIAGLGCTGIYLTPIFSSPSVHKYDTSDYLAIEPAFGTEADLKELVTECHARGMRIMLDAVFNHAGKEFGPWKDVVEQGAASRYRDWFHIRDFPLFPGGRDSGDTRESNFEGFAFTTKMPKLNTTNPETRSYLFEVAERYVREFGIDGWRLDVSNEIDHAFWREFRRRVKALNPELYIVGEVWHDAMPWLRGDQYDAVMNYPFGAAISDFLLAKTWVQTGKDLVQRIAAIDFAYPKPVVRSAFNLLDSHDTERIRTKFGSIGRVRQALSLLFSLPGAPCVYYGTEYALEGGGDPDNRRCMPWDPQPEELAFTAFLRALIHARQGCWKVVADGERLAACLDGFPGFVAMGATLGAQSFVTLVNRDDKPVPERLWRKALEVSDDVPVFDLMGDRNFGGDLGAGELAVLSIG